MDHNKTKAVTICLFILLTLCGCALTGQSIPPWREPGEKMLDLPEKIWKDYNCRNEALPIVKIEQNELIPQRLNPEKVMTCNHRLVYGLCADDQTRQIAGKLFTRIYYREKLVHNEIDDNYAIKPGRWRVDTFITLPKQAASGVYTLEIEFASSVAGFSVNNTFIVEPKEN
jgi:hypothetical protein